MRFAAPLAGMHVVMVFHVLHVKGESLVSCKIQRTKKKEPMEKGMQRKLLVNIFKVNSRLNEKQKRFGKGHVSALNITLSPNLLPIVSSHPNLLWNNVLMLVAPDGDFKGFLSMFILLN